MGMPLTINSGQKHVGNVGYLSGEWHKIDFNFFQKEPD